MVFVISLLFFFSFNQIFSTEITPYKFTDKDMASNESRNNLLKSFLPTSDRHLLSKGCDDQSLIVYYFSKPKEDFINSYPITILCEGSSAKKHLYSVLHFHRYFLKELQDLGCAVVTIEKSGIDGTTINEKAFWSNYTRNQRLLDHKAIVENFLSHPPQGWNGKFIFFGVSEGAPLVTDLTTIYSEHTLATVNAAGAGDFSWSDELWDFIQDLRKNGPWTLRAWDKYYPRCLPFASDIPWTREEYDKLVEHIKKNPSVDQWFMGLPYLYMADAFQHPGWDYEKIKTPFLVVMGALDSTINSCDLFVAKAQKAEVPITYIRVAETNHYVCFYPKVVDEIFRWLDLKIKLHNC